jgi:hypothetical protein
MAYTVVPASGRSTAILNYGATPHLRPYAGEGGPAYEFVVEGSGLAPINMPTTNFLPLVRIPSNAIIKRVELALDAAPSTSLTGSVGLVFSDTDDGTTQALRSTYATSGATPAIFSQSAFLYQTAITTYTAGFTDITFKNASGNSVTDGFYVPSASLKPIWQALNAGGQGGLGAATSGAAPGAFTSGASDPGGYFDVTYFETTTGINTGTVWMTCRVTFTLAAI